MPNNVEELHIAILKIREELIVATIAKEEAERKTKSLEYELVLLRDQIEQDHLEREKLEGELQSMVEAASKSDLVIIELKQQITNLQQELNTGEETQKDFVRLTQSLQVENEIPVKPVFKYNIPIKITILILGSVAKNQRFRKRSQVAI